MNQIYESDVEELVVEILTLQGFMYLSPEEQEAEREDLGQVVLVERLKRAVERLNPHVKQEVREQAVRQVLSLPSQNLIDNNEAFHKMLTEGIDVEVLKDGDIRGEKIRIVDFEDIEKNEFIVTNQFTVLPEKSPVSSIYSESEQVEDLRDTHFNKRGKGEFGSKRPDVVLFINGLPLVVIELKNPTDEEATVRKAFTQLQNYKNAIPTLFNYNSILVASDGIDAKAGTISADFSRFMAWKSQDGEVEDISTIPQIETLINGMLNKTTLLDLIKQFIVFEKTKKEDSLSGLISIVNIKKIAAYHQYYAVNKALESTLRAAGISTMQLGFPVDGTLTNKSSLISAYAHDAPEKHGLLSTTTQPVGDRKAGVVWHTQGSGKSLSMVFYTGKVILTLNNPTVVVITDRNDLDGQLFDTFAACKQLLRQVPVQAESRTHLKELLKTAGGGIVFTTIQKFWPENDSAIFPLLSERKNIIVIADEAHRSQYGFAAKSIETKGGIKVAYGFAKYIRDALPNASFIGFTGTPIEKEDASTPAVFGNYIDIYDIARAVDDEATVRIYYESRLAKVHLKPEEKEKLDDEVENIIEGEEFNVSEKAKAKWAQLEAIVGHKNRIEAIAKDIVEHFETRQEVFEGKGLIVAMSRRIAVELYDEIIKIRPQWHDINKHKGSIKVIMTSTSSDPENWQIHNTTKEGRKEIGDRFKDPSDPLKLVIVRDMWLTGFDVPSLHTMYIDKPMSGHNLMQAIARVNRVFKDKPGGLIVDYIGIASDLKTALVTYTANGGKGRPALDQEEAVALMLEKYEIVVQMFSNYDYKKYFSSSIREKLTIILESQEYILGLENGKERFIKQVEMLSKAFALSVPHAKAMEIKDEVGYFQAIKARLIKFEGSGGGTSDVGVETAIKQIVDRAVVSEGVVDVFDAAGIKKPDISILSDDFLEEIKGMERKNLGYELLKKLLNDEIRIRSRKNFIKSKKFSEMLENAIKRYQNKLITAAQVLDEMIRLAKDIRESGKRGEELHLSDDELAFYDALANNESAKDVLGDEVLRDLARVLVQRVKANTSIDWTVKESVQAKLRVIVRRTLRQYGYPPDAQLLATENVLKQAELLADEWSS